MLLCVRTPGTVKFSIPYLINKDLANPFEDFFFFFF